MIDRSHALPAAGGDRFPDHFLYRAPFAFEIRARPGNGASGISMRHGPIRAVHTSRQSGVHSGQCGMQRSSSVAHQAISERVLRHGGHPLRCDGRDCEIRISTDGGGVIPVHAGGA